MSYTKKYWFDDTNEIDDSLLNALLHANYLDRIFFCPYDIIIRNNNTNIPTENLQLIISQMTFNDNYGQLHENKIVTRTIYRNIERENEYFQKRNNPTSLIPLSPYYISDIIEHLTYPWYEYPIYPNNISNKHVFTRICRQDLFLDINFESVINAATTTTSTPEHQILEYLKTKNKTKNNEQEQRQQQEEVVTFNKQQVPPPPPPVLLAIEYKVTRFCSNVSKLNAYDQMLKSPAVHRTYFIGSKLCIDVLHPSLDEKPDDLHLTIRCLDDSLRLCMQHLTTTTTT